MGGRRACRHPGDTARAITAGFCVPWYMCWCAHGCWCAVPCAVCRCAFTPARATLSLCVLPSELPRPPGAVAQVAHLPSEIQSPSPTAVHWFTRCLDQQTYIQLFTTPKPAAEIQPPAEGEAEAEAEAEPEPEAEPVRRPTTSHESCR